MSFSHTTDVPVSVLLPSRRYQTSLSVACLFSRLGHTTWNFVCTAPPAACRVHPCHRLWFQFYTCRSHDRRQDNMECRQKVRELSLLGAVFHGLDVYRLDIGGKLLTNQLKELVSFRQWNMMDETYIVNQVKESSCYVSTDFGNDLEACR
jgi:Actin